MKALILVDLQNDFVPGGALAVPRGDEVIAIANEVQARFDLVVATQDWHPTEHGSFASNNSGRAVGEIAELQGLTQVMWPDHCVQGTKGAEFVESLDDRKVEAIFRKGTDPLIDSYSGFFDNGRRKSTGLADYLRGKGVTEISVLGLALDYCVKFTALDAAQEGFATQLIVDACRAVDLAPGDGDRAIAAMTRAGVAISNSRAR